MDAKFFPVIEPADRRELLSPCTGELQKQTKTANGIVSFGARAVLNKLHHNFPEPGKLTG